MVESQLAGPGFWILTEPGGAPDGLGAGNLAGLRAGEALDTARPPPGSLSSGIRHGLQISLASGRRGVRAPAQWGTDV